MAPRRRAGLDPSQSPHLRRTRHGPARYHEPVRAARTRRQPQELTKAMVARRDDARRADAGVLRGAAALRRTILGLLLGLAAPLAEAQDPGTWASPGPPQFSDLQLDQMLAPIALYPDDLLGPLLIACTYPLEIVQADRWLQDPLHAALRGAALAQALQPQAWDASVKAMVAFPQVLSALDNNLEWAEQVGDAFLSQGGEVMDRVQQLRARAQSARTLNSGPQQVVSNAPQEIDIHPPGDDVLYVPEYDPNVAYGQWPYPDEPPDDFELPDFVPGGFIAFTIIAPLWFPTDWDWHRHRLGVGAGPGAGPAGPRPAPGHGPQRHFVPWQFNPQHRHGVPLHASAPASVPLPGAVRGRAAGDYRGYAPGSSEPAGRVAARPTLPSAPRPVPRVVEPPHEARREPPPPELHAAPPAFESFGHASQVHQQEQRGASSRLGAPAPAASPREHR
jgi:hypothetical protein